MSLPSKLCYTLLPLPIDPIIASYLFKDLRTDIIIRELIIRSPPKRRFPKLKAKPKPESLSPHRPEAP